VLTSNQEAYAVIDKMRDRLRATKEQLGHGGENVINFPASTPSIGLFSEDRALVEDPQGHAAD
jgi:hypothetical protein